MSNLGMVLCNNTVRYMLLNFARSVAFSAAPSFPVVASIRSGYRLLMSGETQEVSVPSQIVDLHITN